MQCILFCSKILKPLSILLSEVLSFAAVKCICKMWSTSDFLLVKGLHDYIVDIRLTSKASLSGPFGIIFDPVLRECVLVRYSQIACRYISWFSVSLIFNTDVYTLLYVYDKWSSVKHCGWCCRNKLLCLTYFAWFLVSAS